MHVQISDMLNPCWIFSIRLNPHFECWVRKFLLKSYAEYVTLCEDMLYRDRKTQTETIQNQIDIRLKNLKNQEYRFRNAIFSTFFLQIEKEQEYRQKNPLVSILFPHEPEITTKINLITTIYPWNYPLVSNIARYFWTNFRHYFSTKNYRLIRLLPSCTLLHENTRYSWLSMIWMKNEGPRLQNRSISPNAHVFSKCQWLCHDFVIFRRFTITESRSHTDGFLMIG